MITNFNPNNELFIVYVIFITSFEPIYPFHRALIGLLKVNKAPTIVLFKYANFANIFFGLSNKAHRVY